VGIVMSQQNLDRFLKQAAADPSLTAKVQAARTPEELIQVAADHGHELHHATVVRHNLHNMAGMSDEEITAMGNKIFEQNFGDVFIGRFI
jgi:predicted ribosomally synthesized peptide with nif11-like leader